MNNYEIDYLKFKLNELRKYIVELKFATSTDYKLNSNFKKHLNYYRKFWIFDNNPSFSG